ncbi:hypothetical protein CIPAW_09G120500 [Carya illinoinensis]|uniref:Uncharacterized protein n=1 Tax=Carya illinoinensis TaxID=32201 RepID=A0A8T1PD59_CARIL|nr:hypothetical protein CIPAW_09G120500 [Carya illinoinensis]
MPKDLDYSAVCSLPLFSSVDQPPSIASPYVASRMDCLYVDRHVVKLDLKNPVPVFDTRTNEVSKAFKKSCLGDKISPSLLELKLLSYRDLSLNYFNGDDIPTFLGSLESLRYLNLSFSSFGGVITPHLGNLSRLQYLDLNSLSFFDIFSRLEVESLHWLAGFPSLKYLSMSHVVNLYKASDWLQAVNVLPSLSELHLDNSLLEGQLPSSLGNLTNLHILDLSGNKFIGEIPSSFANLSQLQTFDQKSNNVSGEIVGLVDANYLSGGIPPCLGNLSTSNDDDRDFSPDFGEMFVVMKGNYLLCGPPLPNKCPGFETEPRGSPGKGNGEDDRDGKGVLDSPISFYFCLVIGFIVGFWGVCGTLIIKTSWRLGYFRSFDHMKDKIYIFIMVKLFLFLRRIKLERR